MSFKEIMDFLYTIDKIEKKVKVTKGNCIDVTEEEFYARMDPRMRKLVEAKLGK